MREPNVFAGARLDRLSHRRIDGQWLERIRRSEAARVTLVWRSKSLVTRGDSTAPACFTVEQASSRLTSCGDEVLVFLGTCNGRIWFALDVSHLDDPLAELRPGQDVEFLDLRQIASVLERDDGALLAYARAMMTWHRRHAYCGACGAPTRSEQGGHQRRCSREGCGTEVFPRTDPAVIMLVVDGDWCLLGRQARWPPGVYSALAGFVEPGESLEDAVRREVQEETGVEVGRCFYHSSQPWPFPSSLMLGFHATARRGVVTVDGDELEEARWFERSEIVEREIRLPPRLSIARRLIEEWATGEVEPGAGTTP